MPSSCRRISAADRRCSRIRSPALSCATSSSVESHSGVAYSGCDPTSRYRRAPFSRNTFEDRPQWTTRRNRYRATSSGLSRRCPRKVHVTPYSFSSPKIRRSIRQGYVGGRGTPGPVSAAERGGDLRGGEAVELAPLGPGPVHHGGLDLIGGDLTCLGGGPEDLHGRADRCGKVPVRLVPVSEGIGQLLGVP